jgi:hypothetical protein
MAGAAPLSGALVLGRRRAAGEEKRAGDLDRDCGLGKKRRVGRRQCIRDLAVAHRGGCATGNITRSARGRDALRIIDQIV